MLTLLRDNHNVLINGPSGTGKTRLLREVVRGFKYVPSAGHDDAAEISVPPSSATALAPWLPSPHRTIRDKEFYTAFDQTTRTHDVLRGLVPVVGASGLSFRVSNGILYRAAQYAATDNHAALLVIDEISRGPAVAAFGASIVALDGPKRLKANGERGDETTSFQLLSNDGNSSIDYCLPADLYILAAMNQADTSVEPLDIAFIRRFVPYRLEPSESVIREHFALPDASVPLVDTPLAARDVYEAFVQAWMQINRYIKLGRGADYRIGHGVLIDPKYSPPSASHVQALDHVSAAWQRIRAHVDEVFFNDTQAIAEVLAADAAGSPYRLVRTNFANVPVVSLEGSEAPRGEELWRVIRAIAKAAG